MSCSLTREKGFKCHICDYTTPRKYNLERHIATVHNVHTPNISSTAPNVSISSPNISSNAPNISMNAPNVSTELQIVDPLTCLQCKKQFSNMFSLRRHVNLERCKKTSDPLECPNCHAVFAYNSSKSRHMRTCKAAKTLTIPPAGAEAAPVTQSAAATVNGDHNTVNQTNVQNQQIILNFPQLDDTQFAFIKDHITPKRFEKLIGNHKPAIGFARYTGAIMERPENRMIYKSNPNTKYCKVHNDKVWEYVLDEDAFPVLTFHMTCAALEDTHAYKKLTKQPKIDLASLLRYLDDVNTENDDNPNYQAAVERLKLQIINLSQAHKIPTVAGDAK